MKKALIFIGGNAPDLIEYSHELIDYSLLLAADSGYDLAVRDGITVDLLIGDMDSIAERPQNDIKTDIYPQDKDYTDTELAIKYVHDHSEDYEIVLIGGGEGRFDHTMALVSLYLRPKPPVRWYTSLECLHFITEDKSFSIGNDKNVSIMGVSEIPSEVSSEGLFWELHDFPISLANHSISNRTVKDQFTIFLKGEGKGVLVGIAY